MAYKSTMLFDAISNVLTTKSWETYRRHVSDERWKDCTGYMLRKYMTMVPDQRAQDLVIRNYVQLERLDDKTLYAWLIRNVPRQRSGFVRYVR